MVRFQTSSLVVCESSSFACMMPALLKSTFNFPNFFSAAATICSQSLAFATSAFTAIAFFSCDAVSCAACRSRRRNHGCAFLGEKERRLPADAAARARDERNLVFESHILSKYLLRSQSVTARS